MEPPNPWSSEKQSSNDNGPGKRLPSIRASSRSRTIDQNFLAALNTMQMPSLSRIDADTLDKPQFRNIAQDKFTNIDAQNIVENTPVEMSPVEKVATLETARILQHVDTLNTSTGPSYTMEENTPSSPTPDGMPPIESIDTGEVALPLAHESHISFDKLDTSKIAIPETPLPDHFSKNEHVIDKLDTNIVEVVVPQPPKKSTKPLFPQELVDTPPALPDSAQQNTTSYPHFSLQQTRLKRGTALLLIALLGILVLHTISLGQTNFLGSQGWASVLGAPTTAGDPNLLKNLGTQLKQPAKSGTNLKAQMTPQQYIDLIIHKMTLDQKLGQMMIVQFTGAAYDLPISTMISQYNVGAVLVFSANGNIVNKDQLTGLIKQMKDNSSTIPLAVAIDQEGGTVDRLVNLDGARPAEATIGATNDAMQAKQAGIQDARDLTSYGFNLNLAPVVDVTNVYNPQLYNRTYGDTPGLVTKMAAAYLQGLQQSGKVAGTLKHFPGLGDVGTDPHVGIPYLNRAKSDLEQIDWSPYRNLIKQGNVHAIMVTHEIVAALDTTKPSSLSPKVIQDILRNDLGFQGVVMTDSLTMDALTAYAPSEGQAAVMSIEAGSDLIMGPGSPSDVASVFQAIKQTIGAGELTEQRIDESVRRILMMKYSMGLLPIPRN